MVFDTASVTAAGAGEGCAGYEFAVGAFASVGVETVGAFAAFVSVSGEAVAGSFLEAGIEVVQRMKEEAELGAKLAVVAADYPICIL